MANQQKPVGIPEPTNDPDSLWRTTQALKEAVEILQGTRGNRAAALKSDLTASVVELTQVAGGAGISSIVEDLTPQLGGNLDVNNFDVTLGTAQSLYFYDNAGTQECFRVYNFGANTYGNHNFMSRDGQSRCTITNNPLGELQLNRSSGNTNFRVSGFQSVIFSGLSFSSFDAGNYSFDVDQTVGATEQNYALIYDDVAGQISLQSVGSNILADGSVTLTKFSDGLEPVSIVTSLPTLPDSNYPDNSVVVLTTDSLLYRNSGGTWVKVVRSVDLDGTIDLGSQISGTLTSAFAEAGLINSNVTINADGTLTGAGGGQASLNSLPGDLQLNSFSTTMRPVLVVNSLPALPDSSYPNGAVIVLTTNGKLYRNDGGTWTAAVPTADLSGTIDLGSQISGTLTAAFAEAGLINSNVTINANGTLSGAGGGQANLGNLPGLVNLGTQITGTLTSAFAESGLINSNVTINADGSLAGAGGGQASLTSLPGQVQIGSIAANAVDTAQLNALAVTAAKIAGNTITANEIAGNTITAAEIAGLTITAAEIAGTTITGDKIAGTTITGDKIAGTTITGDKMVANTIDTGQIAAGAITTDELAAGSVTAAKMIVADWQNYYPSNGGWEEGTTVADNGFSGTSWSTTNAEAKFGSRSATTTATSTIKDTFSNDYIPVEPGEQFYFTGWYKTTAGASQSASDSFRPCFVQFTDEAKATPAYLSVSAPTIPQTAWTQITGTITVPAGKYFMRPGCSVRNTATAGSIYVDGLTLRKKNNGNLIVDGAITTNKIGANQVTANEIKGLTITAAEIAGNTITANEIKGNTITANEIAGNTITADEIFGNTITAGQIAGGTITASELASTITWTKTIIVSTNGQIRGGQTAFNTGNGFYLGWDATELDYVFSIGDGGTGDFLSWDGNELIVRGNVSIGSYTSSTTEVLLAANTNRSSSTFGTYVEVKKFEINKPGTVLVYFTGRLTNLSGGLHTAGYIRVKLDGVVQGIAEPFSTTSPSTRNKSVTTTETSQFITIEYKAGQRQPVEPLVAPIEISMAEVRAIIDLGEAVITN